MFLGMPTSLNELEIILTRIWEVLKLSLPPLRIIEFPDFNEMHDASTVTFGLDS